MTRSDTVDETRRILGRFRSAANAFLALLLLGNLGCPGPSRQRPAEHSVNSPIRAAATVGMVADLVRAVGADHVEVTQIMGAGVDPHLYKPTRDDVQTILDSDIVFFVGLKLEGKMSDVLSRVGETKPAIAVGETLDPSLLIAAAEGTKHYDPHVWMDVGLWMQCLDAVTSALEKLDPSHTDTYRQNAKSYRERLSALHEYGRTSLATIPEASRILVTSHDAFHYFGRAYGLDVQGVQGISTESEAGLKQVNDLVNLIVARKVKAVFVESSVPRKGMEAVVEGVRSRDAEVLIGGTLFSDAMGEKGSYEGTYEGMLDHNITSVTLALGGNAPPNGMSGKLTVLDTAE